MMNNKLILLTPFVFVLCILMGCGSKIQSSNDSTVHVKKVHEDYADEMHEFFLSLGKDTMALSFLFHTNRKGELLLEEQCWDDVKYYMLYEPTSRTDTNAIVASSNPHKAKYRRPSYHEVLSSLGLCLSKAKGVYNLNNLHLMKYRLMDLPDINIAVCKQIQQDYSHQAIDVALKETGFKDDLSRVLRPYGLKVANYHSQEEICLLESQEYIQCYGLNPDSIQNNLIDVEIVVEIIRDF
ncbi:MAG: hypothetical protein J6T43_09185 [Prevotella sp.]|nr:hypothetical protein [Prevotella sp.]